MKTTSSESGLLAQVLILSSREAKARVSRIQGQPCEVKFYLRERGREFSLFPLSSQIVWQMTGPVNSGRIFLVLRMLTSA